MKKQNSSSQKSSKVPIFWRIISVLLMFPLGIAIFAVIFRKSGGKFPIPEGASTDPFFFAFIFGVLIPTILYWFIVDKVLKGIAARRPTKNIAADVTKDIARSTAEMAAEVVIDSVLGGSSGDSKSSSSGSSPMGGGGEYGGGGASGGY